MAQPGDVVITTKEMYDEVRATHDAVKELRGEVKTLREDVRQSKKDQEDVNADHESRLRSLERRVYMALGGGTAFGAVAGAIVNVITGA